MRDAEGRRGSGDVEIRPPMVVDGDPGRVPHDVAPAFAHAEVAQPFGARNVRPGEAAPHTEAGFVHVSDGSLRHRVPNMAGEAFEAFGGARDNVHDGSRRHLYARQFGQRPARPPHGNHPRGVKVHGRSGEPRAIPDRGRHARGKVRAGGHAAGGADAPVCPVPGHFRRRRPGKVRDPAGRGPDGHPGIQGPAAARTDGGIMIHDVVGMFGTAKRVTRVTRPAARPSGTLPPAGLPPLPQFLRRRLRQPVARRRPAAAGAARPQATLQLRDARGLDGSHGIAVRRQGRDPVGQCPGIVDRSWHGMPVCPVRCP